MHNSPSNLTSIKDDRQIMEKIWAKYSIEPKQNMQRVDKFSATFDQMLHSLPHNISVNGMDSKTAQDMNSPSKEKFKPLPKTIHHQ